MISEELLASTGLLYAMNTTSKPTLARPAVATDLLAPEHVSASIPSVVRSSQSVLTSYKFSIIRYSVMVTLCRDKAGNQENNIA